jgi:hypothetical protein
MMYPITNKISSKPLTFFHNDREDIDYKAEHGNKTVCKATSVISNAAGQRFTNLLIKKRKGPLKIT